jgi:hypothetical protein
MAMDFPNTPTTGDKYPTTPAPGQPQYTWNGTMWTTHGIAPPGPGRIPVYTDGSNAMTGQLTLVGDPVAATNAADKHYVDSQITGLAAQGNIRYDVAQTLTGAQQTQAQANIGIPTVIPSGTTMVFYQAAAPTGWTKQTTQNDKALRVVSGSGGVAGGTNPFSTVMAQTITGDHTLARAEIPAGILSSATNTITVYIAGSSTNYAPTSGSGWTGMYAALGGPTYYGIYSPGASTSYASYGQYAQNIQVQSTNTGGGAHNHPLTMAMQYCDVILCSKN